MPTSHPTPACIMEFNCCCPACDAYWEAVGDIAMEDAGFEIPLKPREKPMTTPLTLEQFDDYITKLARHDWYYGYSDDHRVWRRGETSYQELTRLAKQHPLLGTAKAYWTTYVFDTKMISQEQAKRVRDIAITTLRQQLLPAESKAA